MRPLLSPGTDVEVFEYSHFKTTATTTANLVIGGTGQ
jgi:hypothetical protein